MARGIMSHYRRLWAAPALRKADDPPADAAEILRQNAAFNVEARE
jgi:hypothetical protein